jgi:hypothetical protein
MTARSHTYLAVGQVATRLRESEKQEQGLHPTLQRLVAALVRGGA